MQKESFKKMTKQRRKSRKKAWVIMKHKGNLGLQLSEKVVRNILQSVVKDVYEQNGTNIHLRQLLDRTIGLNSELRKHPS